MTRASLSRALATVAGLALLPGLAAAQTTSLTEDERARAAQTTTEPAATAATTATPGHLRLGRITFFTTRLPRPVLDVPATVSVITREQIEQQNINDMQQLTRYTPGVTVDRFINAAQPFGDLHGFNIRGVGGNRILMMVDGSRVPERIGDGARDYLDFNFVRQAEIVRGPSSTLWGSDALGGVVALRTIEPEDVLEGRRTGGTIRLGYDSLNGERLGALTLAHRFSDTLSVVAGLSRNSSHEVRLSNAPESGGYYSDAYFGGVCPRPTAWGATGCNAYDPRQIAATRGLVRFEWRPSSEHRVTVSADSLRRVTDMQANQWLGLSGTTLTHAYDRELVVNRTRFGVDYSWTPETGFFDEVRAMLAFTPNDRNMYSRRRTSSTTTGQVTYAEAWRNYHEDFLEFDLQASSQFNSGALEHELTFGLDFDRTEVDFDQIDRSTNLTTGVVTDGANRSSFANATTTRADLYIQDRITWGRLELTPGLRYATYEIDPRPGPNYFNALVPVVPTRRTSRELLGSFSARWRFNDEWTIWGTVGQGFKNPTAQQLYSASGTSTSTYIQVPAPDLLPEEVLSYELGLRGEFERGFVSTSVYFADYTNFIENFYFIPGTNQYTYRNLSERQNWGLELAAEWQLDDRWTLNGSLNWQQGIQRAEAGGLRTRANLRPLTAVLGATLSLPEYDLTLDFLGRFAGGVNTTSLATASGDAGFRPGGYGLLDITGRWDVTSATSVNFGILNVFDRTYYQDASTGVDTSLSAEVYARQNPIGLYTGPGRTLNLSLNTRF